MKRRQQPSPRYCLVPTLAEVTSSSDDGSGNEGNGSQDSFMSEDGESDQSGEWRPASGNNSSESDDYEVPSQMSHLQEEGMSPEDIAQLEGELEVIADRIMAMNAVGLASDAARVMLDGGTFKHMFGRGVHHLLDNRRKVHPLPISTAGGTTWVDEMADLTIGK